LVSVGEGVFKWRRKTDLRNKVEESKIPGHKQQFRPCKSFGSLQFIFLPNPIHNLFPSLHIQTRHSRDIPLNHLLTLLHLLEKLRISNQPRCILDFPTRLIQSRDNPYYRSFKDIRKISNILETHAASPLIDYFHETESWARNEIVGVRGRQDYLVVGLSLVDLFRECDDGLHTGGEGRG